jgi:hypothetical protein
MTLVPLSTCCLSLGVDPKTLRLWLKAAQLSCSPHPADARLKCLTLPQLEQIAQLHHRPLQAQAPQPVAVSVGPPTSEPPSAATAAPPEGDVRLQLSQLQQQVVILQAQVTELALALLALRSSSCQISDALPLASSGLQSTPPSTNATAVVPVSQQAPVPSSPPPEPPRARSRALPLIQIRPDGSLVVIAPTQGVLPLLPDSPEWFAWLASIEAFSFESSSGRFSATRKFRSGQRIQSWNVHCSLHGRSCTLYLGLTPTLTLARLQEMAVAVRARLTSH